LVGSLFHVVFKISSKKLGFWVNGGDRGIKE